MNFFNPFILIGLLAAFIPLFINFFNRRKTKTIEFSSLLFFEKYNSTNVKKIKIKQILLLFIRTLIIICIVLFFSRPFVYKSIKLSDEIPDMTKIFILDDSYSMSLKNENGNLFDQAKEEIIRITKNHFTNSNINVQSTSGKLIYSGNNKDEMIRNIKEHKINYFFTYDNSAITRTLDTIKSKNYNIYYLSDFVGNNLRYVSKLKDKYDNCYFIKLHDKNYENIGIEYVKIDRRKDFSGSILIEVLIKNYSNVKFDNRILSLYENNNKIHQKNFSIEPFQEIKKNFNINNSSKFSEIRVQLNEDDIEIDNKKFTFIKEENKKNIFVIYDNATKTEYLKRLFEDPIFSEKYIIQYIYEKKCTKTFDKKDIIILSGNVKYFLSSYKEYLMKNNSNIIFFAEIDGNIKENLKLLGIEADVTENKSMKQLYKINLEHSLFNDIFLKKNINIDNISHIKKHIVGIRNKHNVIIGDNNDKLVVDFKPKKLIYFALTLEEKNKPFFYNPIFVPLLINSLTYFEDNENIGQQGNLIKFEDADIKSKNIKIKNEENEFYVKGDKKQFLAIQPGIYKLYDNEKISSAYEINIKNEESNYNSIMDNGIKLINHPYEKVEKYYLEKNIKYEIKEYFFVLIVLLIFVELWLTKGK